MLDSRYSFGPLRRRDFASDSSISESDLDGIICQGRGHVRGQVDRLGLDAMDRRYLRRIADHHGGGPVGVETLAAALAEARDTLEDVIEPYLIQQGFLQRTPRGRIATLAAYRHLGITPPATGGQGLFESET